jgi:hypothetical protein
MACEACVYGRGAHAMWCQEGLVLDPTGPTSPITPYREVQQEAADLAFSPLRPETEVREPRA